MTQQNIATMQDILDALNRDPDLQREFHKHLVAVVRSDDELRGELRKEILTEELLQLPARFTRFEEEVAVRFTRLEEDVTGLKEDMTQVKDRVIRLEEGQARLEEGQARMSGQIARMSGQIANLQGNTYEIRAIEGSRRLVRRDLDMEQATILYASDGRTSAGFEKDFLIPAIRAGRLQRRHADELENADCIIQCEDSDGKIVFAVVEISMTVQEHDRSRAVRRAELFELATGRRTLPYVVGIDQEAPGAEAANAKFLEYRRE